jgi:hypothetical protein
MEKKMFHENLAATTILRPGRKNYNNETDK